MAQIPKGRLVKGPYKPICRDCTIYFWNTASWFFTCLTDSTTVKTPSNHHLGNIFRWLPTTEQANLKRRSRQFWGASFRTSCFSINYSDQAGAWSPPKCWEKKDQGRAPPKSAKNFRFRNSWKCCQKKNTNLEFLDWVAEFTKVSTISMSS